MTAPYYLFLPFNMHFDGGFGATGDAFKNAGDALKRKKRRGLLNSHLPLFFLYRHAIELYLKSVIIVLSRRLSESTKTPAAKVILIKANNKQKPITAVHSIGDLYRHFKILLQDHWGTLRPLCKTDWSSIPKELDGWIKTIEEHDPGGTFLRYPSSSKPELDHTKDAFKKSTPSSAITNMQPGNPPQVGFFFIGNDNVVNEAFAMSDPLLPDLSDALTETVETLSGAHMGIRIEFGGGY